MKLSQENNKSSSACRRFTGTVASDAKADEDDDDNDADEDDDDKDADEDEVVDAAAVGDVGIVPR
jgi:hypothetical protein